MVLSRFFRELEGEERDDFGDEMVIARESGNDEVTFFDSERGGSSYPRVRTYESQKHCFLIPFH